MIEIKSSKANIVMPTKESNKKGSLICIQYSAITVSKLCLKKIPLKLLLNIFFICQIYEQSC